MHYPKVLERVDFPEQIFHRSFSLGAPGVFESGRLGVWLTCYESSQLQTITTWNSAMHHYFVQPHLNSQFHNTPTFLSTWVCLQRSLLSFTSSLMEYNFLMNVISQNSRFRAHFVPPPFTSHLILLHIIWLICMWLMCVWTIKQNKGAHLTISFMLCWRFLAEKQTGKSFKLQMKREQATSPNF